MIAIGLHYSAYLSEVYRGGPRSSAQGTVGGLYRTEPEHNQDLFPRYNPTGPCRPRWLGWAIIWSGYSRDTPMLSVIGVAELMQAANAIGGSNYRYLEPYTMVGITFLAISLPAAGLIKVFEAWVRKKLGMN